MSNPERGTNEFDPGYDAERVSGDVERERLENEVFRDHELDPEDDIVSLETSEDDGLVRRIEIPGYDLRKLNGNPYRYDANPKLSLEPVATALAAYVSEQFEGLNILIRGVQSARHPYTRHQLVEYIRQHGSDRYSTSSVVGSNSAVVSVDMYGAQFLPWTRESSLLGMLEGFHTYKPKCDEVPQTPVDIVMIYDANSYDQIEYVNQRHGGIARDAYMLRPGITRNTTLLAIILINDANYDDVCYKDMPSDLVQH